MVWNNKKIDTMGQVMDAAIDAMRSGQAMQFKQAYIDSLVSDGKSVEEATFTVNSNLGYMSGYCDPATAKEIMSAYETSHPVFGTTTPTVEMAFEAGRAMISTP